jgi:hypothetical protein
MIRLNLEWKILDDNRVALVFDKTSWVALQTMADSRGLDTSEMITEAVVKLLGPVLGSRAED